MRIETQTIRTAEDFLSLREEWNSLLESSSSDCVFLTHEWLSAWWKYLSAGRSLHVVTVRDAGKLIGAFPVAERPVQLARMMPRGFEFIGSGLIGSDYLDVISQRGCESEVTATLARYIDECGLMLNLTQLRSGSCVASMLREQLRRHDWTVEESKTNICPYIDLRGHTWESYLATLGPNVRKNINRYLRNLPKSFDMRVDCATTTSDGLAALEKTIDLHHRRWGTRGKSEAFHTIPVIAFHREFVRLAAERGWLRLLVLSLDGTAVAALYGLRYGPTFYFYQSGFDPAFSKHSVGATTMGLAIKTAIEEGASEYDFLHGDEEYKFHWASGVRDLNRLELHPPHTSAWIYRHALDLNRAARQMAKRLLSRAA